MHKTHKKIYFLEKGGKRKKWSQVDDTSGESRCVSTPNFLFVLFGFSLTKKEVVGASSISIPPPFFLLLDCLTFVEILSWLLM